MLACTVGYKFKPGPSYFSTKNLKTKLWSGTKLTQDKSVTCWGLHNFSKLCNFIQRMRINKVGAFLSTSSIPFSDSSLTPHPTHHQPLPYSFSIPSLFATINSVWVLNQGPSKLNKWYNKQWDLDKNKNSIKVEILLVDCKNWPFLWLTGSFSLFFFLVFAWLPAGFSKPLVPPLGFIQSTRSSRFKPTSP